MSGIYSALQLTAIAGLLQTQGFRVPSAVTESVDQYNQLTVIATLLDTIGQAPNYGLSSATIESLQTFAADSCPALAAAVPEQYADTVSPVWSEPIIPTVVTGGFAELINNTAERYLGLVSLAQFCGYFSSQQSFRTQTNQLIYSAVNSTTWLGPTFTSMNSLISAGITDVSLALPALSADLLDLGNAIDPANIDLLGTPAGLLQQISRQAEIAQGTLPCVQAAFAAEGFTEQEINDLATPTIDTQTRLTANEYNALQKRAYPVLEKIKGDCLDTILQVLEIRSTTIKAQNPDLNAAGLLDPKVLFPRSYRTLTVPQGNKLIPIYDSNGSLNSEIVKTVQTVNSPRVNAVNCDQLAKIIPPEQAVASQAVVASFSQVENIRNVSLPEFAKIVGSIQTLKGLDQLELLTQPVPDSVTAYYQNNIATGSGDFGTFLVQDFLGTLVGAPAVDLLNQATSTFGLIDLSTLENIYSRMLATVQGTYGPVTGPVSIPPGPGAGVYASGDDAFVAGLIPAAETEISNLISVYPAETLILNQYFDRICQQLIYEAANQDKAGISFDDDGGNEQSAITSFVQALPGYAEDRAQGGAYEFLAEVADFPTLSGQSILASMREGSNQVALGEMGVVAATVVPDTYPESPMPEFVDLIIPRAPEIILPVPEYQTPENPISVEYSPPEITTLPVIDLPPVISDPLPTAIPEVEILAAYANVDGLPGQRIKTLLPATGFFIKARIRPTDSTSMPTQLFNNLQPTNFLKVRTPVTAADEEGFLIEVPAWMVPNSNTVTLTLKVTYSSGDPVSASQTFYVEVQPERTVSVFQPSWWRLVNQVLPNSKATLSFQGVPLETVTYESPWGPGTVTLDSNGNFSLSSLDTPPLGSYNITANFSSYGVVTQEFLVTEVPVSPVVPDTVGILPR